MQDKLRWPIVTAIVLASLGAVVFWTARPRAPSPSRIASTAPTPSASVTGDRAPGAALPTVSAAPSSAVNPAPSSEGGASAPERADVVEDAAAPQGALEGRVLSVETGLGVPGAELTFEKSATAASARSDASGRFTFAPPQPGAWRLAAASAQGFLPFAPEWGHSPVVFQSAAGRRIRGVQVFLTPAIDYLGVVLSPPPEPAPVRGAEVRLLGASAGDQALLPLRDRFATDERGEFHFQAPDNAALEARHPDFAPGRAQVDFSARVSHRLVIALGPRKGSAPQAGSIAGRVVDPRASPVAGALVSAAPEAQESDENPSSQTTTDAQGRFRLEGLEPGRYRVAAQQEGWAPALRSGVSAGAGDLLLELGEGAKLVGSVRDVAGQPIPSFAIRVLHRDGPLRLERAYSGARFDPQGQFEIAGLPPGPALVSASAPGFAESKALEIALVASPAPAARADLVLSAGARLTGRVVERGTRRPLAGARVQVEGWSSGAGAAAPTHLSAATDASGGFAIAGLRAGKVSLQVSAAEHDGRIVPGLQLPESGDAEPVTVELTPVATGEAPRLELAGLGLAMEAKGDALVVDRVLALGGGAEAGLVPGDAVLAIDGKPAVELGFEGAINLIRGPEGSEVALKVRRADGQVVEITARRRIIRN